MAEYLDGTRHSQPPSMVFFGGSATPFYLEALEIFFLIARFFSPKHENPGR